MAIAKNTKTAAPERKRASLSPASFSQGGLIDDVDVTFEDVAFTEYDYNGKAEHPALALAVQIKDDNGAIFDQYYSAGDLQYFVPSEDGAYAEQAEGGTKEALNNNTNCAKFLQSLIEAGLPEELLAEGNCKNLIGLRCHVNRIAQPKRAGLVRTGPNADREQTILLVTKIIALPGAEAPAKAGVGKVVGKTAAPATKAAAGGKANGKSNVATEDIDTVTTEVLMGILAEAEGNSVPKRKLAPLASAAMADSPLKARVVTKIFSDAFLKSVEGITFDGATVTLGE